MGAGILDGKSLAADLQREIAADVDSLKIKNIHPCLAVCLIGDDPASNIYVSRKQKACDAVGIRTISLCLPSSTSQNKLLDHIAAWNEDDSIHGILVQLPLPDHLDRYAVVSAVSVNKDVDGFHSLNMGRIVHDKARFLPCTPSAIKYLLSKYIDLDGKNVTVINDTIVVGRPLSMMLLNDKATVTVCHDHTKNLKAISSQADVIVVAVGKRCDPERPFKLTADMVKPKAVVVDVGINRLADGKVVGDADFDAISRVASLVTPVPGGVGPLTISMLLRNTVIAAQSLSELNFKHEEDKTVRPQFKPSIW